MRTSQTAPGSVNKQVAGFAASPSPRPVVPPRFGLVPAHPAAKSVEKETILPRTQVAETPRSHTDQTRDKATTKKPHSFSSKVALLSFFDGIGSAHQSLVDLQIEPIVSWSWEVDPECNKVVRQGIRASCCKATPCLTEQCPSETFVVIACAPPCPDFSKIKGDAALGTGQPCWVSSTPGPCAQSGPGQPAG